ncbi:hypothetical protein VTK56DRAFT_5305 [Thermocarpiscus australiensis]
MARITLLILLAVLATLASASVPTFCKCTCFKNSTIIQLGPDHDQPAAPPPPTKQDQPSSSSATSPASTATTPPRSPNHNHHHNHPSSALLSPRAASASCAQCNRAFCLKYNLPFCKDAEEKDIVTSCFQRDSRKDRFIVWGFILGTAGLLGWAGLRKAVEAHQQHGGGGSGSGVGRGPGMLGALAAAAFGNRGGGDVPGENGGRGVGLARRGAASGSGPAVDRGLYSPLGNQRVAARGPG